MKKLAQQLMPVILTPTAITLGLVGFWIFNTHLYFNLVRHESEPYAATMHSLHLNVGKFAIVGFFAYFYASRNLKFLWYVLTVMIAIVVSWFPFSAGGDFHDSDLMNPENFRSEYFARVLSFVVFAGIVLIGFFIVLILRNTQEHQRNITRNIRTRS
jgi:hypothetical protein